SSRTGCYQMASHRYRLRMTGCIKKSCHLPYPVSDHPCPAGITWKSVWSLFWHRRLVACSVRGYKPVFFQCWVTWLYHLMFVNKMIMRWLRMDEFQFYRSYRVAIVLLLLLLQDFGFLAAIARLGPAGICIPAVGIQVKIGYFPARFQSVVALVGQRKRVAQERAPLMLFHQLFKIRLITM